MRTWWCRVLWSRGPAGTGPLAPGTASRIIKVYIINRLAWPVYMTMLLYY